MNLQEFASQCADEIERYFDDVECVDITKTLKNNGRYLTALRIIRKDSSLSPVIYLDDLYKLYQEGTKYEELIPVVFEIYKDASIPVSPKVDFFLDYNVMKDRVYCKLINLGKNKDFLETVPYVEYLNLAIVFYTILKLDDYDEGTITITNDHFNDWGITKEQLYKDAMNNTFNQLGTRIKSIVEVLGDLHDRINGNINITDPLGNTITDISELEECPMYVMSNESGCLGAITMLNTKVLSDLSKKFNTSIFILPSSIHELILVPDFSDGADVNLPRELYDMVVEVNKREVGPSSYLANCVYKYYPNLNTVGYCLDTM